MKKILSCLMMLLILTGCSETEQRIGYKENQKTPIEDESVTEIIIDKRIIKARKLPFLLYRALANLRQGIILIIYIQPVKTVA